MADCGVGVEVCTTDVIVVEVACAQGPAGPAGPPGADLRQESFLLTQDNVDDRVVVLATPMKVGAIPLLWVLGGVIQAYSLDYTVVGDAVMWTGLGLEEILEPGDTIQIQYEVDA